VSPTYTVPSDQLRRTPRWLYRACCDLAGVDDFTLDAFADADNALCLDYLDGSAGRDGLTAPWADWTFANPPFKLMARVVGKVLDELRDRQVRTVLIGPAGCSQAWFHALWPWAAIHLPTSRLNFLDRAGQPTHQAMKDNAVYVVDGVPRERLEVYAFDVAAGHRRYADG
jgi:hypothetical protein